MENLHPPLQIERKSGNERFMQNGNPLGFTVCNFWQWMASDLISNSMRGIVAEFLVAQALGIAKNTVRHEWSSYDLDWNGLKIEVKSAAYIQSWAQKKNSAIQFVVKKTHGWDKETNVLLKETKRWADIYVFALLAHQDYTKIDSLDVDQWKFYILPTYKLDDRIRSQYSITLNSLKSKEYCPEPIPYQKLREVIAALSNDPKVKQRA